MPKIPEKTKKTKNLSRFRFSGNFWITMNEKEDELLASDKIIHVIIPKTHEKLK